VVVATDSTEVINAVSQFGGEAIKTSKKHRTGSDRTAEVAKKLGGDIIINIQADNLGVKAGDFDKIITAMQNDKTIKYATFAKKIETEDELYDPNRVKVVCNRQNDALWFSRYPLPFLQGENGNRVKKFNYYYHVGIYFYKKSALQKFADSSRTQLEKAESLEQLRILENGGKIKIFKIKRNIWSIDSPDDVKKTGRFL
ncbi:MAG: 3-deoxy-manno-octulosonate cytidylyltransferase, partial [candidate division Zixibacteria bacterium]|nr:3-deoxy-manno-octulosonate cytidylyltransferase [candidate division Zixibacteria bacterium]